MKSLRIENSKLPLIVIVGPTASGKTGLAIELAGEFGGEIVCADSRTIYQDLDIGTAKPSLHEQERVPHWGLDLIRADETFSVAEFKNYALDKIAEIRSRGKIPFLVGGSGLYVDAVVFDFQFFEDINYDVARKKYNKLSTEELMECCQKNKIGLPENWQNRLHLINHLAREGRQAERRKEPIDDCLIFGLKTDKDVLRSRIRQRIETMLENEAVVKETLACAEKYSWEAPGLSGNIYPLIRKYIDGEIDKNELIDLTTTNDWRLAKRQTTWFRRNKFIEWRYLDEAEQKIAQKLRSVLK